MSVLIIDVDHFKKINDQFGHPTGDEVLKAVATAVRALVRSPPSLAVWAARNF